MTAPAALKMTYSDIKTVKTRSVYQVVLEGPLEEMEAAMKMLGAPNPKAERWVAVALLTDAAAERRGGKLAQMAGIVCQEGAFHQMAKQAGYIDGKAMIYAICDVTSRRELDHDEEAGRKFRDLKADYEMWLKDIAA